MAKNLPTTLNLTINPIGMAFAIAVLLSITTLALINRNLANRMTVRLVAAIATADLMAHAGEFYAATNGGLKLGSAACTATNGFRLFARTFYCFTNLAICYHLYRSMVMMKKTTWKHETTTWVVMAIGTVIVTLFYYGIGAFSGTGPKQGCNPGPDGHTLNVVFFIIQGSVNMITAIVGIFTTIQGRRNLNKFINVYSATLTEGGENQELLIQSRRKMASRSFLYPLSTCITLPFEGLFLYFNAAGTFIMPLAILMAISTALSGILTGLAFAVDPATHQAFKSAYYQIKYGVTDKKYFVDQAFNNRNDIPLGATQ